MLLTTIDGIVHTVMCCESLLNFIKLALDSKS